MEFISPNFTQDKVLETDKKKGRKTNNEVPSILQPRIGTMLSVSGYLVTCGLCLNKVPTIFCAPPLCKVVNLFPFCFFDFSK